MSTYCLCNEKHLHVYMEMQEHVHALKTDHHLVVKGSGGTIFALGDAATIQQDKALDHAAELFRRAFAAKLQ